MKAGGGSLPTPPGSRRGFLRPWTRPAPDAHVHKFARATSAVSDADAADRGNLSNSSGGSNNNTSSNGSNVVERSELERAEAEKEVLRAQMRALEERMAKVREIEIAGETQSAAALPTVAVPEVGPLKQTQSLRPAGRISSDSSVSVAEAEAEAEEDTRTVGRWRASVPRSASLFLRNRNKGVVFNDGEGGSPREEEDVTTRGLGVPRNFSFGGGKRAKIEAERERERAKAKVRARLEREAELELLAEKAEKDRLAAILVADKEDRRDKARAAAALKETKAAAATKKAGKQTATDKDVEFTEAELHDEFSSNMDEGGTSYEEDASASGLEYVSTRGKVPNAPPSPPKILYAPVTPGPTPKEMELKRVKTLKEAHERANAKRRMSMPSTTVDVTDECVVDEVVADTVGTSSEEEDDGDLFFDDDAEMVAEEVSVPSEQAQNMFTPTNSNSPVSAASLAAASRARIAALEAGYKVPAASSEIFGVAPPAGPVREKPGFKPVQDESPFSSVRLKAIPRSASEAPRRMSAADTTAQQQLEELQSLRERMQQEQQEQQKKVAMAIPRSASLYSSASARSSSIGSSPSSGRRHPGQMIVSAKSFSPHSTAGSPDAFDATDQARAFKTPTGWSTRPVEVPKAEKVDPKRQREEQRIKEAREKSHKLSPDDPNYRRRRRTAAVNLVDAFKEEEKAPIPEVSIARIPRSASSRVAGISGGPSFRRIKSRKAAVH